MDHKEAAIDGQDGLVRLDAAAIEKIFLAVPSPKECSVGIHLMDNAESRNAILGITELKQPKVWIDTYYPLLETPGERRLELLDAEGAVSWSANLEEHPGEKSDVVGAWHAWSKAGDVKARIVYVNYGYDTDYAKLKKEGYDVTGTIVLLRESYTFRGIRIKQAAAAGAIGCLTYKDHEMDGSVSVHNGYKAWPEGPSRNPDSVTRGHVMDISMHSGDPTTPGYPSYKDALRVEPDNYSTIPSLPISWNNAQVLLKEIERSGGRMSEREVYGASDPTSGTVSLHEMSRGLGQLHRQGWKPLRTIILASWDAEEYGLFGSTEWAEDFQDWLKEHAVAYLNVDKSSSGGQLRVRGTPCIAPMLRQAAIDLPHYKEADSGRTLWDAREDLGPFTGPDPGEESTQWRPNKPDTSTHGTGIRTLGSGSDYTVFLQQLGITCGDLSFTDNVGDASYHYHSFYDSEEWMEKYGDPGCLRRVAIAKYWGMVLLRMADSFILPLDTTQYALELNDYLDKVADLSPSLADAPDITPLRGAIKKLQEASQSLDLHKFQFNDRLIAYINLTKSSGVRDAWGHICEAFESFDSEQSGPPELGELIREARLINKKLSSFERGFISEDGLPGRKWYRHLIVAPGKWIGYGATTFPSLTEAISHSRDHVLAKEQVERLCQLLHTLADFLYQGIDSTEQHD
ncbi:hypothetical protein OPQ81_005226 [Rhizoctonia solani]|nr:hypothetical protein OPQ81_005226 [Rhizoctonia solani]